MKEAYYFPHDHNAHNDPKLLSVFMEHGLAGLGLYWILIELMHQQDSGRITIAQYENYIKWYCSREESTLAEQLLNTYLTQGLFYKTDGGFVCSRRVLQNKEYRDKLSTKRSEAGKKSAEARAKSTSVEQVQNFVEQGNEMKGNETKVKDTNTDDVYTQAGHLSITHDEFTKLEKEFGMEKADELVQSVLNYRKNSKYKSLYLTAQKWGRAEKKKLEEPIKKVVRTFNHNEQ